MRKTLESSFLKFFGILLLGLFNASPAQASKESCAKAMQKISLLHAYTRTITAMDKVAPSKELPKADSIFQEVANQMADDSFLKDLRSSSSVKEHHGKISRFVNEQIGPRLSALKGSNLRNNSVCRNNFLKNLSLAWGFQLFGYWGERQSKLSSSEKSPDFPFDILTNTAFLIYLQQEIACAQSKLGNPNLAKQVQGPQSLKDWFKEAAKIDRPALKAYFSESLARYKELLLTIPVGIATYTFFAAGEDFIRREWEIQQSGQSDRPEVFSKDYLKNFAEHAFFIGTFEVLLFARISYFQAPLELKWLPSLHRTLGSNTYRLIGQGAEWAAYRIPMGLVDGRILMWWKGQSGEIIESFHSSSEIPEDLVP